MTEHYGEKEDERKTTVYVYQTTRVICKYAQKKSLDKNDDDKGE